MVDVTFYLKAKKKYDYFFYFHLFPSIIMKLECLNKDVMYLCYFNIVNRSLNLSQESTKRQETN